MQQENSNVFYIPLDQISENPFQCRKEIPNDHIGSLASDIRMNGLLEMPAGRAVDKDGNPIPYQEGCEIQLAYGHCRHKAFYLLDGMYAGDGYDKLPVKIKEFTDEEMALVAWSENETRKQLNAVERAQTFQQWIDKFGWTQQQIADKVRLERSTVSNLLRLLSLPQVLLYEISAGNISQRQATAMIPFYDLDRSDQDKLTLGEDFHAFWVDVWDGKVSSDTIRDRITAAIAEIHPAPPQFDLHTPLDAFLESENKTPAAGETNSGDPYPKWIRSRINEGILTIEMAEAMNRFYLLDDGTQAKVRSANGFFQFWTDALRGIYTPEFITKWLDEFLVQFQSGNSNINNGKG